MSDNVAVTAGTGTTIAADEVADGTLGTVKVQYVKLMDGTLDGTSKAAVGANGLAVSINSPVAGQAAMAASLPVAVASNQATLAVADDTSQISNGASGTMLAPSKATIVASSSGATTLVALVSAKKIRVLALFLTANGSVNVKFQSHVTPTDISGLLYEVANSGIVLPYNPLGWFDTIAGEALDINLSGNVAVGGGLVYVAV